MPRVKQFSEEDVLEKAMELFWHKGFHATSMQDLIDHLSINRASLYDTFGDKQALFDRALVNYKDLNQQRLLGILNSGRTVKEGFKKLFDITINNILQDPDRKGCFMVNTATSISCHDANQIPLLKGNQEFIEHTFLTMLQKAEASGEIENGKNLSGIAASIFTFFNGLQVIAKINPNKKQLNAAVIPILSLLD